ncbi:DeoR/GlpR family DNA-binding transcription regulator [Rhodobacter sp. CZR27]|uniref:DeoR/GlpR family DNA-binding transcription regulator n=1 Tax=Rhodobacter sp. CZR27 TaxID=2033869 RepID=UPI000BBE542B|nr:DeoR/GlpR family DNA-binding transcription regulator [Rhodobacter sp. CZR27]
MLAIERQRLILESLDRDKRVLVSELSTQFSVSEETIRRDLQKLEREGRVARAHGGAIPSSRDEPEDLPYPTRQVTNIQQKRKIAALAAELVTDGAAVMIDSSSTAFELLTPLARRRDLTVITNSVRILASPLAERHVVISAGGELRHRSMTLAGHMAIEAIGRFTADIAFISCKALSLRQGVMDPSLPDADMKRAFIAHARRVCLLADGDKFDQTGLISVCDLDAIDLLVTDRKPSDAWMAETSARGVTLIHGK